MISVDPTSPFTRRRAARRPDPARRALPRSRRLHPLDGHARPRRAASPRRPLQAVLVLGAAGKDVVFVETVGTGQSEIGVRLDRRHRRARADAGLGRRGAGAEGRDHGDPRRDRDQQARPAARRGRARASCARCSRSAPASRPRSCCTEALARRGDGRALGGDRGAPGRAAGRRRASRERRAANLAAEVFAVASARARRYLENAVADDPELARAARARCGRRELDPLTRGRTRSCERCSGLTTKTTPTLADIEAARERIGGHARVTPVYGSETLAARDGPDDAAEGREPPAHGLVQDPRRRQQARDAHAGASAPPA